MTTRDRVWDAVLLKLIESGKFRISDLEEFDEGKRHTVRRVLKDMEELDWLERESERAAYWRMGPKARQNLNVSPEKIEAAKS